MKKFTNDKAGLAEALRWFATGPKRELLYEVEGSRIESFSAEVGICKNISSWRAHLHATGLMTLWPEYSGQSRYPVKHPHKDAGHAYYSEPDVWVGEYGETRKRLCIWLAERLELEVKSEESQK